MTIEYALVPDLNNNIEVGIELRPVALYGKLFDNIEDIPTYELNYDSWDTIAWDGENYPIAKL